MQCSTVQCSTVQCSVAQYSAAVEGRLYTVEGPAGPRQAAPPPLSTSQNMMAEQGGSTQHKIDLSKNEISRIAKALKEEEFVKLLADYAREIHDPENKKKYEAEIAAMEEQRGCAVTFINPTPGYVIKSRNLETGKKVFVNICSDGNVGKPSSKAERVGGSQGLSWAIPYSQSQPRKDIDRGGDSCEVYDVIFHPDTLYLAGRDPRMKGLVHSTAMDALDTAFQAKCDKVNLKFPRMKFKGVFRPTILRKPLSDASPNSPLPSAAPTIAELAPELASAAKTIRPVYSIKYRSTGDLQDHIITPQETVISGRPRELVVEVLLPLLDSAAGVDLDVQERSLSLVREEEPQYRLHLTLPYPVDEEKGSAKFDKSHKVLAVTLPVKAAPQLKAERLSSNDSGIEEDSGYRIGDSESITEGYRTNQPKEEEGREETDEEQEEEEEMEEEGADGFLDKNVPYSQPGHTIAVETDVIIVTLDVKNVTPGSFVKQVRPNSAALAFKFSNIGSGHVEIHHALAIDFLIAGVLEVEKIEVEFWDNNVIVSLPKPAGAEAFRAGLSLDTLDEKLIRLESCKMEVETKDKKKKSVKYKQEKHPKVMPQEEQESGQWQCRRERTVSGDSLDSCMSESPMESIILKLAKDDDEGSEKTEDSCDEDIRLESPRYLRATSDDSTQVQPRGILKRKISGLVGTSRFRCYSESNLDDVGWSTAEGKATSALSQTAIAEDKVMDFNASLKKSVRFNEKVEQQLYR